jgi:hypothetical protein
MIVVLVEFALPPGNLFGISDVHVLDSDRVTIDPFQVVYDVFKRAGRKSQDAARVENPRKVLLTQAKIAKFKGRPIGSPVADGVGLGEQMPPCAIPVDQLYDLEFFVNLLRNLNLCFLFPVKGEIRIGQVIPLEKTSPAGLNRIGILEILLV